MSQKYRQYLEAQKRDNETCTRPGCGRSRGMHVGDKHCIVRQVGNCTCPAFLGKEAARESGAK